MFRIKQYELLFVNRIDEHPVKMAKPAAKLANVNK
jgi:hypothetical protein